MNEGAATMVEHLCSSVQYWIHGLPHFPLKNAAFLASSRKTIVRGSFQIRLPEISSRALSACNWSAAVIPRAVNNGNRSGSEDSSNKNRLAGKNHYEVLGLGFNATQQEIKTAFRQLVHKYHPDVNKAPCAAEAFKCVRVAYEVLSNETTRRDYDRSLYQRFSSNRRSRQRAPDVGKPPSRTYRSSGYERFGHYATYDFSFTQVNFDRDDYTGRRRRKFEPTWIRQVRGMSQSDTEGDVDTGANETRNAYSASRDWIAEWKSSRNIILLATWTLALLWHIFGIRFALAALVLALIPRNDFSTGYKLALAVACLIGGAKGVGLACFVLGTNWIYGVAYDAAVLAFLLGLWLHGGIVARHIYLPPVIILLMAYKLIEIRPR